MWCLVHGMPELCTRRRKGRSGLHLPPGLLTAPLLVSAEMPPPPGSLPCLPPVLPAVAVGLSLGLDLGAFEGRPCSFSAPSCLKECLEPQQVPREHRTNDGVGSSEYPRACGGSCQPEPGSRVQKHRRPLCYLGRSRCCPPTAQPPWPLLVGKFERLPGWLAVQAGRCCH